MGRVFDLQAHEQFKCLDGVEASVNEVTDKDVVGAGKVAAALEEFEEIVKLAMDIADDGDWVLDFY